MNDILIEPELDIVRTKANLPGIFIPKKIKNGKVILVLHPDGSTKNPIYQNETEALYVVKEGNIVITMIASTDGNIKKSKVFFSRVYSISDSKVRLKVFLTYQLGKFDKPQLAERYDALWNKVQLFITQKPKSTIEAKWNLTKQ
jgi:hypothetical protein